MQSIKEKIRTIPNFPKKGVMFRDITTLLKDPEGLKEMTNLFFDRYKDKNIDVIAGIESRGFIVGSSLAYALDKGFIPIRKKGKLPSKTISKSYNLEYGTDSLEIHEDAIKEKTNVLLIDDLIATGGTLRAAIELINKLKGNIVEIACIVELPDLNGREKIEQKSISLFSLVSFEGE